MSKVTEMARVLRQDRLADGVYSLWLETAASESAVPGQFVSLYCHEKSRLLPRPISICERDREKGALRLVYRLVGNGTREFSHYTPGDEVQMLGPLGNGFPLDGEKPIVIGGGIGVPPMLQLSKE